MQDYVSLKAFADPQRGGVLLLAAAAFAAGLGSGALLLPAARQSAARGHARRYDGGRRESWCG